MFIRLNPCAYKCQLSLANYTKERNKFKKIFCNSKKRFIFEAETLCRLFRYKILRIPNILKTSPSKRHFVSGFFYSIKIKLNLVGINYGSKFVKRATVGNDTSAAVMQRGEPHYHSGYRMARKIDLNLIRHGALLGTAFDEWLRKAIRA